MNPMNETLTRVLKEVIDRSPKDSPYVFTSHRTSKAFRDIKNGFKKAVKRIGLEGFRFHDLRHTLCSRMCELGIDEATIMELGGWKTRSMINRYAHPSMDHKRAALEKLNKVPPKNHTK
jgi:integrase